MKGNRALFLQWLKFLSSTRVAPRNYEFLRHFFFDRFRASHALFYKFIVFLRNALQKRSGLDFKKRAEKKRAAHFYLHVLSPLCERVGFFEEKSFLDDLCFSLIAPKRYHTIHHLLATYQKKSETMITKILSILSAFLKNAHRNCEMKGRYKSVYSISKKLRKVGSRYVLGLNDIFAFRIIVKSNITEECFEILNALHDAFYPIPDFFKDYITIPKINGYQSLHTGLTRVISDLDLSIEVQIRTQAMDDFAERGLAAHWFYSEEKKSQLITEKEAKLLDYFTAVSGEHHNASVYFFSNRYDLFRLPRGATVLDFAYHIHTELGDKATAALVNGRQEPLSYVISDGDHIQVLQSSKIQVDSKWLKYAQTKEVRKKIAENLKRYASQKASQFSS